MLECEATRSACGRIDLAELHALADDLRRMIAVKTPSGSRFIDEARAVDSRLHDLIAESCGNAFLAKEISRLKTLFRVFRDVAWEHDEARNDYHRLAEEAHEHLAIVEALLAGDAKAAARAMARHIRSGLRYWSRAVPAGRADEGTEGNRGRGERSDATEKTRCDRRSCTAQRHGAAAACPLCPLSLLPVVPARAAGKLEYNRDVRPILAENCFACHGPDSAARKADLRLDRRDDAVKAEAHRPRQARRERADRAHHLGHDQPR